MIPKYADKAFSATVRLTALLLLAGLFIVSASMAQSDKKMPEKIYQKTKMEIIDSVSAALNEIYVFPEVAAEMEKQIRKNFKDKKYDKLETLQEFGMQLNKDLREISKDKHLNIGPYNPDDFILADTDTLTDARRKEMYELISYENFGFEKAERMPGNIGYIKFNSFKDADYGGPTAVAALNFLSHCDAIIFDLRDNGGGSPSMIQLISSYFFEEPVHLNSFYIRKDDSIKQFWTSSYVPGPKMVDADLYVLTSNYTFSGAEEFTYNMKNLKRATIVGETTGGGAHPVEGRPFPNLGISMSLPFGRAINPISGTNWEGIGVEPDIKVTRDKALDVAYNEAVKKLYDNAKNDQVRANLEWIMTGNESKLNPVELNKTLANKYAGVYGPRTVIFEDGNLYYQREGRSKYKMIPMSDNLFRFDELDYFRLEVEVDDDGNPVALVGHYQGGHTDRSPLGESK